MRMTRAYEFKRLTHTGCGSVDDYASRFIELSICALGIMTIERQKVNYFIYGLQNEIEGLWWGKLMPCYQKLFIRPVGLCYRTRRVVGQM